jgi:hypothetical protein
VQYYICLGESACEYECECSGWRYLMTNVCFDCCSTIVGRACARESELLGGGRVVYTVCGVDSTDDRCSSM